ncbi:barstar family protein [Salmonella enterica]|nr:barstar family protein [Salmonella enterica]
MDYLYQIYDEAGTHVLSCQDLIECHDCSRTDDVNLFALVGLSTQCFNFLLNDQVYTLKCSEFQGRLDFDFYVKKIIKSNNMIYLNLVVMNSMYKIGVLSLLKSYKYINERIWLNLMLESKRIYISASYMTGGLRDYLEKDTITIEGKYIHDYYSFYCEVGYAFFGMFGYMGNNLDAFNDCIIEVKKENIRIKVIWKDSDLSFKAIDNTMPSEVYPLSSYDMVNILREHCDLILE